MDMNSIQTWQKGGQGKKGRPHPLNTFGLVLLKLFKTGQIIRLEGCIQKNRLLGELRFMCNPIQDVRLMK